MFGWSNSEINRLTGEKSNLIQHVQEFIKNMRLQKSQGRHILYLSDKETINLGRFDKTRKFGIGVVN